MQFIMDILPVILFFVAYKTAGIFTATAVAIVTTLLLMVYAKVKHGKIEKMLMINGAVITVMGGITLLLHDKTYIMWKPTVLYAICAIALLMSRYAFKNNLIKKMLGGFMAPPEHIWDRLNMAWAVFMLLLSGLNLYVAYAYSEEAWVNFKLFGTTTLMFVFMVGQVWLLKAHWIAPPDQDATR